MVAVAAQDVEAEAVEHEALIDGGDGLGFEEDEARDCGVFTIGQAPIIFTVEVADGDGAVNGEGVVFLLHHAFYGLVMFVIDLANDFFQNVF